MPDSEPRSAPEGRASDERARDERTPGSGQPARLIEDWLGAAVMAVLALITFANVIARYFTDQSFAWTEEISVSLMVVLTMVAAGAAVMRERHIRIEFFFAGGTKARQRALGVLSSAATAVAFLCLAGLATRLAWDDFRFDVTSPGIGVPQWWYTIWLPLLSLAIALRAWQRLVRIVRDR